MTRLAATVTEKIRRDETLGFEWVGKPLEGFEGDTIASALWANGVRTWSRSFEYHRPRGLYDLEGEGSSQLVSIDGLPNQSAGTTPLRRGMRVTAQNVKGDPRFDPYGVLDRLDRFMPAGFYYRLFHRPYRTWPFFQNRMRALAGLGELDIRSRYDAGVRTELYLNADVAVVGAGPAGLSAALAAAAHVDRVCLFERRPWLGGRAEWRVRERADGEGSVRDAALELAAAVEAHPSIRVFANAPVTGVWGENLVTGFQVGPRDGRRAIDGYDERHWECRARAVVVATGAIERPLVFEHNDRPGVLQTDTAWRLARHYGVAPGDEVVFSTADDMGLEAAADLADLGVGIALVADARFDGHDARSLERLRARGVEVLAGWAASKARGRSVVSSVEIAAWDGDESRRIDCDALVTSAGRQPELGVLSTAGAHF
ncbi:MAG: 2Fe-2S iron-sulfur cluster-binding protein, partial [Gemmatimonadota bacterium]|nr:2Fe-2S iron-sulfur cluster-binding protein [Gemmatimonadota bacterium]